MQSGVRWVSGSGKKVGDSVLSEWKRAKRKRGWSYHQPRPGREVITQLPPEPWVMLPVQSHSCALLPEEILFLGWRKKLINKKKNAERAPIRRSVRAGCSQHACLCLCEYVLVRGREDFDIENARKCNPGSCSHTEQRQPPACHQQKHWHTDPTQPTNTGLWVSAECLCEHTDKYLLQRQRLQEQHGSCWMCVDVLVNLYTSYVYLPLFSFEFTLVKFNCQYYSANILCLLIFAVWHRFIIIMKRSNEACCMW